MRDLIMKTQIEEAGVSTLNIAHTHTLFKTRISTVTYE